MGRPKAAVVELDCVIGLARLVQPCLENTIASTHAHARMNAHVDGECGTHMYGNAGACGIHVTYGICTYTWPALCTCATHKHAWHMHMHTHARMGMDLGHVDV